jgi:hypothetical protein
MAESHVLRPSQQLLILRYVNDPKNDSKNAGGIGFYYSDGNKGPTGSIGSKDKNGNRGNKGSVTLITLKHNYADRQRLQK